MANKKLGSTLRALRRQCGYTQQQVADLLGLKNKSTLGSWEVGKSEPDGYTFLRLCRLYQVEDIYLAFGEVSPAGDGSASAQSVVEKYNQLREPYRQVVETLLTQLLEIQGAEG